jgi:hypothetical protein
MRVDSRLTSPIELILAVWAWHLSRISRAASAGADVLAAARLRLFAAASSKPPTTSQEGLADVIVLSDGRKRER